ncbi:MAG: DNA polymerase III subunit alpha [Eubacteriales bacterium]
MQDFTHIHVHSEYSLLDGAARITDMVQRARSFGMTSLAITDHGVMYGAMDFYAEARKNGIKPIVGCEMYIVQNRMEKTAEKKEYAHLILLAKDYAGYKNLMKLVSIGFVEGFYYKPRIDYELLKQYAGGLVCTSACLAGDIQRCLMSSNYAGAKATAEKLHGIFGDDFYLEIMDHGIPEQKLVNPQIIKLARELDIPLVATNDVHYTNKEDYLAQDVLMCIQTGTRLTDENKLTFETQEFYLKSQQEMKELFDYVPDALQNTMEIADKCNLEIEFGKLYLPKFDLPATLTDDYEYLRQIAQDGMRKRYEDITPAIQSRFDYELATIQRMGFVNYFLIVWDFVRFAKQSGIMVGPGRGSAAGSIVAYALEITNIDPIRYTLLFERFLNPERVSMPDIDIDFCYERRQEVIEYVTAKYGTDRVAQIITFGTMGARLVIRDVARVLNVSVQDADRIAKMVPFALGMTIDKAMAGNFKLKQEYENNETAKKIIDIAKRLEGMPRHASTHAAGVVIAMDEITNYVPLQKNTKDEGVMTQYSMKKLESIGLLKMDFLGLRTLTVIRDTLEAVRRERGIEIDIDRIPLDDREVYTMFGAGDTDGVFQFESAGMRRLLQDLKPHAIDDIMAANALFRPGPMDFIPEYTRCKNNPGQIRYAHPILEPILKDTYGCMVYQEQVMQMVRDIAGYSMGRSDLVRRAMSKKQATELERERDIFINGEVKDGVVTVEGALRRGVDKKTASELFDQMMEFANYAFNKSHACAYAVVAYQTAYLKYHYNVEFWTALLNSYLGNKQKLSEYIQSLKQSGISVLPPDVNCSQMKFTVEGGQVRFGFSAIAFVGEAIDSVVSERNHGVYKSFSDFVKRNAPVLNKKRLESLILSGCFDSFGYSRAGLMAVYEQALAHASEEAKRQAAGQISLFDIAEEEFGGELEIPKVDEFIQSRKLAYEKEMTGIYISGHPLAEYAAVFAGRLYTIAGIMGSVQDEVAMSEYDGKQVELLGILSEVRTRVTKAKAIMANASIEDMTSRMNVIIFPATLIKNERYLVNDTIVLLSGRITITPGQDPEIIVDSVTPYASAADKYFGKQLYIKLPEEELGTVKAILEQYPGNQSPLLCIADKGALKATGKYCVAYSDALLAELKEKLGVKNVIIK